MMPKLFLVINVDWFFLSHRKEVALAALNEGYDVTLVAHDTGKRAIIEAMGIHFINLPINPTGMNPLQELRTLHFFVRLFRREKPDIVHLVGVKCLLWGGLAARLTSIKKVVNAVSGLGILFGEEHNSLFKRIILRMLKFANDHKGVYFLFQNKDDYQAFMSYGIAKEPQCYFTKGSGIDLKEYAYTPERPAERLHILFTARMVREKGVLDLISAAELLRKDYSGRIDFWLCGAISPNPDAVKEEELHALCDNRYIRWFGLCHDVHERLQDSHIVAFPSYYREGIPKSLIEACAIGRPIITCNSIGCKEVVENGYNGFLIAPRSPHELAERLRQLIEDKQLRQTMGQHARLFAEQNFAIENVVQTHLQLYKL